MKITQSLTICCILLLASILTGACSREPNLGPVITSFVENKETPGANTPPTQAASPQDTLNIPGTLVPEFTLTKTIVFGTEESEQTTPMPQPVPQSQGVTALVNIAIEDLAVRLDTSQENIQLVQFEAVVWPDGSYGCPQPGVEYPQVQREGYRIQLDYADRVYYYHGGENREPFLCEK
jgi:hypothetical protein